MNTILIERKICLESKYLDHQIKDHILEKLKRITRNECSNKHGYILDVTRLVKIVDNYISSNSDNVFLIQFEANTIKPVEGLNLKGEICMIFGNGVFVDVKKKLKILVPSSNLNDYKFVSGEESDFSKSYYIKKSNKLKLGDIITVCVTGVKHENQRFSCFGKLVEENNG